jgi:hypothetical protein
MGFPGSSGGSGGPLCCLINVVSHPYGLARDVSTWGLAVWPSVPLGPTGTSPTWLSRRGRTGRVLSSSQIAALTLISSILGTPAAPAGQLDLTTGERLRAPPAGRSICSVEAAATPQIDEIKPDQDVYEESKTYISGLVDF